MEALKCHFTRALISVMGVNVNPTVERNENKNITTADFIKTSGALHCTSMQESET